MFITAFAYYRSTWGEGKVDDPQNEHKTAEFIGKTIAAVGFILGVAALLAITISGTLGLGPMGHLGFTTNMAICGTIGGIEVLCILGLALKALKVGEPVDRELVKQD